jgi:hypothetical protein
MPAVSSPPSTRLPYIDDEFDVCEVFEAVFQGDFDVSSSSNGPDALAAR